MQPRSSPARSDLPGKPPVRAGSPPDPPPMCGRLEQAIDRCRSVLLIHLPSSLILPTGASAPERDPRPHPASRYTPARDERREPGP